MVNRIGKIILGSWLVFSLNAVFMMPSQAKFSPSQITHLSASDKTQVRVAHWKTDPLKAKGTIVMLPGLGEIIEQQGEFAHEFMKRGYDVWALDWRAQGKSTRQTSVKDLCHMTDFKHYIEDLKALMAAIPKDQPIIFYAHSMGGHNAVRYLGENSSGRIKAAILSAPMIDINSAPFPRFFAEWISWAMIKIGKGEKYAHGFGPYNHTKYHFNPEKHGCEKRFEQHKVHLQDSSKAIGGPSYGWVQASYRSIEKTLTPEYLSKIDIPVIIIRPEVDHWVNNTAQNYACKILPRCRIVEYKKASHKLNVEHQDVWNKMWSDIDAFLAEL